MVYMGLLWGWVWGWILVFFTFTYGFYSWPTSLLWTAIPLTSPRLRADQPKTVVAEESTLRIDQIVAGLVLDFGIARDGMQWTTDNCRERDETFIRITYA